VTNIDSCDALTAEQVDSYLRRNPDFFTRRPDLLTALTPPGRWAGETVVDIQQFIVDGLREQMDGLRDCATEVIETSRFNMAHQQRTHAAVLKLLDADGLEHLVDVINEHLPGVLGVDVVAIALEHSGSMAPDSLNIATLVAGEVDYLLGSGQDVLLLADLADEAQVFGNGGEAIRSAAFARLTPGTMAPSGVLAMGSRQEGAFNPSQGTELLAFLASVVGFCIHRSGKSSV
jgi:uncharacterized protein YigA (DUF484 family)